MQEKSVLTGHLSELKQKIENGLEELKSSKELYEFKSEYLEGKKSKISGLMKEMKNIAPEERANYGKSVNELKEWALGRFQKVEEEMKERELQKKYQLTTIYITHDLGVVANVADRIAVMYAGDIVEIGTCNEVFYAPQHPYTWALLSSLPQLGIKGEDLYSIKGTPPNLFNKVRGDAFAPRNPHALKIDFLHRPPYFEVSPTHKARTWLLDPRSPKVEPPEHIKNIRNIRANMDQKEGGAQ